MRELIEDAATKIGSQKELADALGIRQDVLTPAKMGRRGLPPTACGKLAEILGIDRWTVIAASELATEKDEEKRAYLRPFVEQQRKAAAWTIAIATAAIMGTFAPTESHARDILNVSDATESRTRSTSPRTNCTPYTLCGLYQ